VIRAALALLLAASATLAALPSAAGAPAVTTLPALTTLPAVMTLPAAESLGPLRVVLESLAPAIPGPKATLRIKGRIINTSRGTIDDVGVRLRRSSSPIKQRADVVAAADTPLTADGREPTDVPLPGTRVLVADRLAPGELRAFTIRIPVSAIGFTDPGSYAVALEVQGRAVGVDEFDSRKGMLRTFVPWFPDEDDIEPLSLAWLWPLASWPAVTSEGVLLDDQLPTELAPGGRLERLASIGQRHQATVSWIVDPSLVQTAEQMTRGYQVVRDGSIVVGDGDEDASQWLDQVGQSTRVAGVATLPYADVDASALTRGGLSTDVVRAVTRGPRIASAALGDPTDGEVFWAPFGRLDQPTLNVLASSGVRAVVLSADAMPSTNEQEVVDGQATAALPTDSGAVTAVLTDPGLTRILSQPQRTPGEVIVARQQFLAETATVAQSLQESKATGRALVAAPASVRWDGVASLLSPLLRATRSAPWLQPITLDALVDEPLPSTNRRRGGYGEKAKEDELARAYVGRIARASEDLSAFTSIIDNPTGVTEPFSEALLRASSAGWRSQPQTGSDLLTTIEDSLNEETALVRVLSEGTITLSGDSGKVPVTITNDLDRSVTVGVALQGRPALRLDSTPTQGIPIEAGKMASIDLDARVIGGEPLTVAVQLLGPDGEVYGKPALITVTSTAYARAAAWVVAAAFVAIVIFVIVGVIRRIRNAHRDSVAKASDT